MFPFTYSPTFEYPLSGDVTQDIETTWFARMKGIPEVEMHVITEAASYGTQLDRLIEAVLELAADPSGDGQKMGALREMAGRIETEKGEMIEKLEGRIAELEARVEALRKRRGGDG